MDEMKLCVCFLNCRYRDNDNATDDENFWIVNENLFIVPILPILRDIRLFAEQSQELIIVDFSDYPIGKLRFG